MSDMTNPETGEVTLVLADASVEIDKLAAALCKAQGAVGPVIKEHTAKVKTKTGPGYQYSYADLAAVREASRKALADNGLCIVHRPKGRKLHATLLHESGQWMIVEVPILAPEHCGPQDYGSALTYARRYAETALLGIAPEDDDGAAAQRRSQAQPKDQEAPSDPGSVQLADEFERAIAAASAMGDLGAIGAQIAKLALPNAEKDRLKMAYRTRRDVLQQREAA